MGGTRRMRRTNIFNPTNNPRLDLPFTIMWIALVAFIVSIIYVRSVI